MSIKFINRMIIAILALIALLIIAKPSSSEPIEGHCSMSGHWYDKDCCSCNDCGPVKNGSVEAYADDKGEGYRHIQTGKIWYRGDVNLRQSRDGGDHVCWPPGWREPNCFYEGPRG